MSMINRRTALQAFGVASFSPLLAAEATVSRKVVVTQPGENRYPYNMVALKTAAACKLTSQDTGGAYSIFELNSPPQTGPPRHVHHREDEWYYVLSGEFLFEVGGAKHVLKPGASIWAPRDIPHVWANTSKVAGRMVLMCQPGGFERFFDELAKAEFDKFSPAQMDGLMHRYGMEMLGPPLFAPMSALPSGH